MVTNKVKIGIIGTGNILGAYVRGTRAFEILCFQDFLDFSIVHRTPHLKVTPRDRSIQWRNPPSATE